MIEYGKLSYKELEDYSNMQAAQIRKKNSQIEQLQARVKELEHEIKMAKRHLRDVLSERHTIEERLSEERKKSKELEALTHKQRDLESKLQGEINHLEAENAELRAELFCNKMCVRYWPSHHVECCLLSARLKRIQQQADDEGEA